MLPATGTNVSLRNLFAVELEPSHQFEEVIRWHSAARHYQVRAAPKQCHRFEILQWVVLEGGNSPNEDMRLKGPDSKHVTVWRCTRDPTNADGTARATHVFNNDGLSERPSHMLSQD